MTRRFFPRRLTTRFTTRCTAVLGASALGLSLWPTAAQRRPVPVRAGRLGGRSDGRGEDRPGADRDLQRTDRPGTRRQAQLARTRHRRVPGDPLPPSRRGVAPGTGSGTRRRQEGQDQRRRPPDHESDREATRPRRWAVPAGPLVLLHRTRRQATAPRAPASSTTRPATRCSAAARRPPGKSNYNPSCAFDLPVASGDSKKQRRSAAYAKFRDRSTGQQFWVVSVHLDNRHGSKAKDAKFSRLRVAQAAAAVNRLARLNDTGLPVLFGGDINSWSTDRSRYAPHRYLVSKGFRDSVSAPGPINHLYPTVNHWRTTLKKTKNGVRLDVVMVKGRAGLHPLGEQDESRRQGAPVRPQHGGRRRRDLTRSALHILPDTP